VVVCIIFVLGGCPSSIIGVLGGLFRRSLVLHVLFLVVPMVVLVSVLTLFYLNMKRVMHDFEKNIIS
jgi:cell division protein FtsX